MCNRSTRAPQKPYGVFDNDDLRRHGCFCGARLSQRPIPIHHEPPTGVRHFQTPQMRHFRPPLTPGRLARSLSRRLQGDSDPSSSIAGGPADRFEPMGSNPSCRSTPRPSVLSCRRHFHSSVVSGPDLLEQTRRRQLRVRFAHDASLRPESAHVDLQPRTMYKIGTNSRSE